MAEIIPIYNQKRMDLKDNPRGVLDSVLKDFWSKPDLEHLALHLVNCISNGIYPQREAVYPLMDMESMVQLKRERRIAPPKGALQAVYTLLNDYTSDQPQKYRFTPYQATAVIQVAIDLGLGKDFDIDYVERIIKKAEAESYSTLLEGRRAISAIVDKRVEIERIKREK